MTPHVYDARQCQLGEGPLWHPARQQLFWFDIIGRKLLTRSARGADEWPFDEAVSAAGWIDDMTLLIASATGLWRFNLQDGSRSIVTPLEGTNPVTRSNDGRADPWGGFWIGTMGCNAEPGAGAIYRLYQGQLRKLFADITISNAICFAPDRSYAYFADTSTGKVMRVPLDRSGWPAGPPVVFIDLTKDSLNPDGAVVDQEGNIWMAQWGAGRVAAYTPDGVFQQAVEVPAAHATCPAFGGAALTTLVITTARQGIPDNRLEQENAHGMTFAAEGVARGLPEPRVIL
ncbi:SMP-30/gluconolactonase/LRE family protein [Roseobacter sp. YSTF-M11]|uniref:SMP-30/gluconolactonase/LRE family protein n=1 Tax=Roseobacter insulae TaxID=2859783 RepID=A0A9X1FYM8_9RHOB|nr:SMP-30/gluconolactonase/LRE family protein [Roseobacter insulae]MBW4710139.1 SMP-30/gluconolactonase/LRE family protein [Roseobacter insulae]